jgi:hypothetical protein
MLLCSNQHFLADIYPENISAAFLEVEQPAPATAADIYHLCGFNEV